jgi:hypothetical protein
MRRYLLWAALLCAGPPAWAQSGDPRSDANPAQNVLGLPLGPGQRVVLPVEGLRGQGLDGTMRLDMNTGSGGTMSIVFKDAADQAAVPPAAPAAEPRSQGWFLAAAAAFLALSVGLWAWVKRGAPSSAPAPSGAALVPGVGITDNFIIKRSIGMGGMGVVYEALDRALDRRVAIKKMREEIAADPAELARFLKEAKTVAGLHHPNIVDIHAVVNQGADLYLVFEYVDGRSVEDLLREHKRLALRDVKAILGPVCAALQFAHERGVIHRDLKPANVMISVEGMVKVMDFGIARKVRERAVPMPGAAADAAADPEQTHTIIGTPMYMSPEAESGVVCRESDVYALGVMLYQMTVGLRPFPNITGLTVKWSREYPAASSVVPGLPAGLDALVAAALEPDYTKRIHSATQFWALLAAL